MKRFIPGIHQCVLLAGIAGDSLVARRRCRAVAAAILADGDTLSSDISSAQGIGASRKTPLRADPEPAQVALQG